METWRLSDPKTLQIVGGILETDKGGLTPEAVFFITALFVTSNLVNEPVNISDSCLLIHCGGLR